MEPRLFEVCRLMVEIPGNWDLTPQPMGGGVTNPAALPPPHFGFTDHKQKEASYEKEEVDG